MKIPAGTKLHCFRCGEVLTEVIKDLPGNEEVRNVWEYLKDVSITPKAKQICRVCGEETDLYRLILETFSSLGH